MLTKRLLPLALALCLLLAAFPALAADTELNVRAGTASNGSITADVVLNGTLTASGVQFELAYDNSMLRLSDHQNGDLGGSYTVNDAEPGKVSLVWYSVAGEPVSGESTVLRLTFDPITNGNTTIAFQTAGTPAMVVDENISNVATQTNDATLTVTGAGSAPVSPTDAPTVPDPYVPPVTPYDPYAPWTIPPEDFANATPSPKPVATPKADKTAAPAVAPTATPAEPAAPVQPAATPIPMTEYDAPQLAQPQNIPAQTDADPQIEVVDAPEGDTRSFPLLWAAIACGVLLLALAVYFIFKRTGEK
ncbi:MAG: cohesin domain-containing protein [Clostridia bacterium]|nr:cohesin domain-containing protein [Clostridia bacterium]